jgi:UDP-N-acetylmuramoyl-L-alanyl-D-glutamate--2,6-diaminopimelate ligase
MPLLLAVTGTNGKTTTVHLLEHLLERLGTPAGVSSTAERGFEGQHVPSRLTTPEADELHALLARMGEQGVRAAAVEVSAQALVRSRVRGLRFQVAGFTNLTHDHLDDFGTMDAYFAAKAALFAEDVSERAVICIDSPHGRRLASAVGDRAVTLASTPGAVADWRVGELEPLPGGIRFTLRGPAGEHLVTSVDALGAHHAVDAALAIVMTHVAGSAFDDIARELARSGLRMPVRGRLEHVPGSADPAVYLDVGHTPDSLQRGLDALRAATAGRLVVVFGLDGDRDPTKRSPMGRIAGDLADVVVVHDHHSRFEDPDGIRSAVLAGARGTEAEVLDVPDPEDAIRAAIAAAGRGGTVLWAGTGRTGYRDIGGVKHAFSFWDEAGRAIRQRDAHPA